MGLDLRPKVYTVCMAEGIQTVDEESRREELKRVVSDYSFLFYANKDLDWDTSAFIRRSFTDEKAHIGYLSLFSPSLRKIYTKDKKMRQLVSGIILNSYLHQDAKVNKSEDRSVESATRQVNERIQLVQPDELRRIFDQLILFMLVTLCEDVKKHQTVLGVLVSKVDLRKVPKQILEKLAPVISEVEGSIELGRGYTLCNASEPRMENAIKNGTTMLVNDGLLVKFDGRITALCIKTFTTKQGYTFMAGCWYTLQGGENRGRLLSMFRGGARRVENFNGKWAYVRGIDKHNDRDGEFLSRAQSHAAGLPKKVTDAEAHIANGKIDIEAQNN